MAAAPLREPGCLHILLGVTGSVATIKVGELASKLQLLTPAAEGTEARFSRVQVAVVATEKGDHFLKLSEQPLDEAVRVYRDSDEWTWSSRSDPVLHIELRKWADVFLIAPLDANTLAKLANGLCDNLLTCVARAWDNSKPLLFAPAMNTFMYEHRLTARHLNLMEDLLEYRHIPVTKKTLVCGDEGAGAMASLDDIVDAVKNAL